jgi:sugar phosphate isomerase/epimerase
MIGISSPSFSFSDFSGVLEEIRKEFKLWEIVAELDHDLPAIEETVLHAVESYDMKFQVHAPIADLNIGSPSERMRQHSVDEVIMLADICGRLSVKVMTIHPGSAIAYGNEVKSRVRTATRESILAIDKALHGRDVKIALENMPPGDWSICYSIDELKSMIDGTDIGICFDVGHANVAGTVGGFLHERDLLANIHLHNNDGGSDQHLALDKGKIDMKPIVNAISRKYAGNYIIEARNLQEGVESKAVLESWLR